MMNDSGQTAGMPANRKDRRLDRLALVTAGTVMLAACIAAALPGCIALASNDTTGAIVVGSNAPGRVPVTLARQDAAVDAVKPADKDSAPATHNESEADAKTTPADPETDHLKDFTPSEQIEADQGVDFPYDI
jgi:hypothetical protein